MTASLPPEGAAIPGGSTPNDLFQDLETATAVVLAVSGGPDSIALMHLAAAWRPASPRPSLFVASVDHGLRLESRRDAGRVIETARALGVPGQVLMWEGDKPSNAIQERARHARYRLLADFATTAGASHLVTAHTLDDQAETLLFRMARGSGLAGLAGMRRISRRGALTLVRPLLHVGKAELVALCRHHGWAFVDDPSNDDTRFARTRWRHLGPALATEGLSSARLGRLAQRLARADHALDYAAREALRAATVHDDQRATLAMAIVAACPDEIVIRVLETFLQTAGAGSKPRLQRIEVLAGILLRAHAEGVAVRRTLAGSVVTLQAGRLTATPEPRRHRGVAPPGVPSTNHD